MARTAKTQIKIRNNGTPLGTSFDTIDLVSGITASDEGSGIVGFTGSGGSGSNIATERVTPVASGSNITLDLTTLSHVFVAIEVVFRNGPATTPTQDWTRSGNTITVFNADNTEIFQVQYTY